MMTTMIATIDVADLGRWSLIQAIRRRPAPSDVPGLRWLDIAPAAALASNKPPGFRHAVLLAMWDDEASAHAYADSDAGHSRAITQQRRKDFHRESAFIRYAVTSSTGRLPGAQQIEFTPEIES